MLPQTVLDDEPKARGYLSRLAAVGTYLDQLIERQRAALAEGFTPPEFLARIGVGYVERYLDAPENDPLKVPVHGLEAERDRLLAEVVRPAYARYRDFLAGEVVPVARPGDVTGDRRPAGRAGAVRGADPGRDDDRAHGAGPARHRAGDHRAAGGGVPRARRRRCSAPTDLAEIFERIRTDPALRWRDGDELLDAARATIARAEAVAPQWFAAVPEQRCEVAPVPAAEAESGSIAYYIDPSLDGSRPGTYYANTHEADQRQRTLGEAIAFHEAVPGHHFQLTLAQQLTGVPLLRRIAMFNAYAEGWGLYAERLADEMGLYSDDVVPARPADAGLDARGAAGGRHRAARAGLEPSAGGGLPAATTRRWRRSRSRRRSTGTPGTRGRRSATWSGRLEIERLRAEAERALGERFDIREFHDTVLGSGTLPLPVLADVVADWVTARAARAEK